MGAGGCPEAPVAGGTSLVLRRGEPTGLVPWGAGAKGSFLHQIESHKKRCFTKKDLSPKMFHKL